MRKLCPRFKTWLIKRANNEERRRYSRVSKTSGRGGVSAEEWRRNTEIVQQRLTKLHGKKIMPPKNFCLDENYENVVSLIYQLKESLNVFLELSQKRRKQFVRQFKFHENYVDFTNIERITPAAALLFAAEFDRMRRLSSLPIYAVDLDGWNPNVRAILAQLGFLRLLNVSEEKIDTVNFSHGAVNVLKFATGRKAQGTAAEPIIDALKPLFGTAEVVETAGLLLYEGLSEAMTNVAHHAYPAKYNYEFPPAMGRWWLTGAHDPENSTISVIFLDQGITIPVSLPRSNMKELARDYLQKAFNIIPGRSDRVDDAQQIAAAMHLNRSSTGALGRGKGLPEMRELIDFFPRGRLRIISRRGEYVYEKGRDPELKNYEGSIVGTLIEWEVSY